MESKNHNSLVTEREGMYVYSFSVPGAKASDLTVMLYKDANTMTVAGKFNKEEYTAKSPYYYHSNSFSQFLNVFTLPSNVVVETPDATLKEGVLTVVLTKKENVFKSNDNTLDVQIN